MEQSVKRSRPIAMVKDSPKILQLINRPPPILIIMRLNHFLQHIFLVFRVAFPSLTAFVEFAYVGVRGIVQIVGILGGVGYGGTNVV